MYVGSSIASNKGYLYMLVKHKKEQKHRIVVTIIIYEKRRKFNHPRILNRAVGKQKKEHRIPVINEKTYMYVKEFFELYARKQICIIFQTDIFRKSSSTFA